MFNRLLALMMCFTSLVCPAVCGLCCHADGGFAAANALLDAGLQAGDQYCQDGCCDSRSDSTGCPVPHEHPHTDHDCFCTGALPAGFQATDVSSSTRVFEGLMSFERCKSVGVSGVHYLPFEKANALHRLFYDGRAARIGLQSWLI